MTAKEMFKNNRYSCEEKDDVITYTLKYDDVKCSGIIEFNKKVNGMIRVSTQLMDDGKIKVIDSNLHINDIAAINQQIKELIASGIWY